MRLGDLMVDTLINICEHSRCDDCAIKDICFKCVSTWDPDMEVGEDEN